MHRIDGDANVANMFDEGDPAVPRNPTQITAKWLNAVQEELGGAIEGGGETLSDATTNQLKKVLGLLGAGADAGGGNRHFKVATGTAIDANTEGTGTDAGLKGSSELGTGVSGTTSDGVGVRAQATGTGDALQAVGPLDIEAAPVKTWMRFTKQFAFPSSPIAGDLAYVDTGAGTNKLFFYDGTGWNSLW